MKIKFIGTGSGKSSLKRYHSSILISNNFTKVLVDTGDGVARALLKASESFNEIDSIIISHYHPDHYSGIVSLLVQMKISERVSPLNIFTHSKLSNSLKSFILSCNILQKYLGFNLNIINFEFNEKIKIADSFICTPKQNQHITNKHNVNADMKFISSSFLFEVDNKVIFYTADIGDKDDLYLFKELNPDLMIVDSTHIELDKIEEAINNLAKQTVYLTHINEAEEPKIIEWVEAKNHLNSKCFIAEDGLVITM